MSIKDFTVMINKATGKRHYLHGPLDGFDADDLEGLQGPIPYKEWTAEDFAVLLGNIIEDRNHHWLCPMPDLLLNALKEAWVADDRAAYVMRIFTESFEREIYKN